MSDVQTFLVTLVLGLPIAGAVASEPPSPRLPQQEEAKPSPESPPSEKKFNTRKVRRAPRPRFSEDAGIGLFFRDVFAEAIRGERPLPGEPALAEKGPTDAPSSDPAAADETVGQSSWSALVPASALEDEVKRQQIELAKLVVNPAKFQTSNAQARRAFEMLAATFAIISEFEDQIRWKGQALALVATCQNAARLARENNATSFNGAKLASDRMGELIRGGSFAEDEGAAAIEDWSEVISGRP